MVNGEWLEGWTYCCMAGGLDGVWLYGCMAVNDEWCIARLLFHTPGALTRGEETSFCNCRSHNSTPIASSYTKSYEGSPLTFTVRHPWSFAGATAVLGRRSGAQQNP